VCIALSSPKTKDSLGDDQYFTNLLLAARFFEECSSARVTDFVLKPSLASFQNLSSHLDTIHGLASTDFRRVLIPAAAATNSRAAKLP